MKKLFTLLFAVLICATSAFGRDVLYLKNGSVIKGELVKVIPNEKVTFSSADGSSTFVYNTNEVLQIVKEAGTALSKCDIVSLKNGSVIKGSVSEITFDGDNNVKVNTTDGSLFVYNINDVVDVTRDTTIPVVSTQANANKYKATATAAATANTDQMNRRLAKRGYRGFVSFNPGIYVADPIASISFSTTHGYQFGHSAFIGGGIGFDYAFGEAYDYDYGYYTTELFFASFYAAFRGNAGRKVAQFTYGTKLGLMVGSEALFMWNFDLGLRLGFTPNFALLLTPDFTMVANEDIFDFRTGFRIGVEF